MALQTTNLPRVEVPLNAITGIFCLIKLSVGCHVGLVIFWATGACLSKDLAFFATIMTLIAFLYSIAVVARQTRALPVDTVYWYTLSEIFSH